ncbi:MAG: N-acyl-L-amino acid amidohydrolase [Bacteroidetes bacterium]|jgi:amidohydrolase|nr:N-acyl-L-amino acid amidohydrolase [Bacteroidota bacterium]
MQALADKIKTLASQNFVRVKKIREHLHTHPELSFKEYTTSAYIATVLDEIGLSYTRGMAGTGIVGVLEGKNKGKETLLLRADMDALPITEQNKVPYRSVNDGVMHACGHDVHSACLLGALMILNELKNEWEGSIKFIFQPGEEVLPGGASLMIKEGVLKDPKVEKAMAQHVFPNMEAGKVGFRKGMYMASTDELYITVKGKGGHAAMPSEYNNPLLIASELLTALHTDFMISKKHQQTGDFANAPTVLAFGKIEGKGATNVIPDTVEIAGTFRTMHEAWREEVHRLLGITAIEIAAKWNAAIEVRIEKGYPFLVNDEQLTVDCFKAAQLYLGKENVEDLALRMTAEDFAFFSQQVPSCFYRLGTGNKERNIVSGVHTPTFDIDEKALETGSGLMAWLSIAELNKL